MSTLRKMATALQAVRENKKLNKEPLVDTGLYDNFSDSELRAFIEKLSYNISKNNVSPLSEATNKIMKHKLYTAKEEYRKRLAGKLEEVESDKALQDFMKRTNLSLGNIKEYVEDRISILEDYNDNDERYTDNLEDICDEICSFIDQIVSDNRKAIDYSRAAKQSYSLGIPVESNKESVPKRHYDLKYLVRQLEDIRDNLELKEAIDHTSGATDPQEFADNLSGQDLDFVDQHGVETPDYGNIDTINSMNVAEIAKSLARRVNNRHNDSKVGDKTIPTVKEDLENLDELSKGTVQSYKDKALDDRFSQFKKKEAAKKYKMPDVEKTAATKMKNRKRGFHLANRKLGQYGKANVMAKESKE